MRESEKVFVADVVRAEIVETKHLRTSSVLLADSGGKHVGSILTTPDGGVGIVLGKTSEGAAISFGQNSDGCLLVFSKDGKTRFQTCLYDGKLAVQFLDKDGSDCFSLSQYPDGQIKIQHGSWLKPFRKWLAGIMRRHGVGGPNAL